MKKWKAVSGVILVFLLGVLAGGLADRMVCWHRVEAIISGGPAARRELIIRKLSCELKLNAEQKAKLEEIAKDTHAQIHEVKKQIKPQVDAIIAASADKVRAMLTPEQKVKFEKFLAEKRAREQKDNP